MDGQPGVMAAAPLASAPPPAASPAGGRGSAPAPGLAWRAEPAATCSKGRQNCGYGGGGRGTGLSFRVERMATLYKRHNPLSFSALCAASL